MKSEPVARLVSTLLATLMAMSLGFVLKRLGIIDPLQGHLKAMGFYVGNIALPLLIFKTVVLAKLGAVDLRVLAACNLGKFCVMLLTFLLTLCAYNPTRDRSQRLASATIFAFASVSSNDFAIGLPVVKALYGEREDNMEVYIAGNALVGALCFVPLTMVMLQVSKCLKNGGSLEEEDGSNSGSEDDATDPGIGPLQVIRDIIQNPVIFCTLLGIAYKLAFSWTLLEAPKGLQFPRPLSDVIDLITSAFTMSALFLTGTAIPNPTVSFWSSFPAIMKVVACAYLTFFIGKLLIPSGKNTSQDFTFFYGSLPHSSAAIIFATQFDPGSAEVIANSILLALFLAGPIMAITALFLQDATVQMIFVLTTVQTNTSLVSLFCGAIFFALLFLLGRWWGSNCSCKLAIAWYGCIAFIYEVFVLVANPQVNPKLCIAYDRNNYVFWAVAVGWLQNSCRLILLLLQSMLSMGMLHAPSKEAPPIMGHLMTLGCLIMAWVPAGLVSPNTLNEICGRHPTKGSLVRNVVWSSLLLAVSIFLLAMRIRNDRKLRISEREAQVTNDVLQNKWICYPPRHLISVLVLFQMLRFLTQVVNAFSVLKQESVQGSFVVMLTLETVLEHGQPVILIFALFFDKSFTDHLVPALRRSCPIVFDRVPSFLTGRTLGDDASSDPGEADSLPYLGCSCEAGAEDQDEECDSSEDDHE